MDWWLILLIIILVLLGIFALLYLLKLYIRRARFTKTTRITDKIVIITGANTGIGKETAIDLAKRGGKIYIVCRDQKRGEDALKEIKERSGSDKVHFMQLDLASLESVRVMACPKSYTADGYELQFGTNHLGHFLLTNLLLDLLKAGAPSRIVVVSSAAYQIGRINKEDLMYEKSYNKYKAYGQSKLANILFTRELAKRLDGTGVNVNSCHPGVVQTELGRYMDENIRKYFIKPILGPFFKIPYEGAQTQIRLAVDPDLDKVTGKYFADCKEHSLRSNAQCEEIAEWLWKKSAEFVGPC
ncbi:hypothetical protein PVAND_006777 [Polypedilum vanderplanki]|uniref:Uncharacterized protein n=1 Tax=Polypedilum vanderplanki TaxID=319348 RepID=A0A9J6C4P0_POLVA|nr:hypothetical protein PVAND_006777 [Polypedilum vanderplanki]